MLMRTPHLLAAACCLALTGCGAPGVAGPSALQGARAAETLSIKGDAAKFSPTQLRQALTLIGERLYAKDFTYDFQKNDAAITKKGRNNQGNFAWLVAREFRSSDKAGQYTFLANEYTKDEAGTMQTQYKVTGTVDLKANELIDIRKEVEDRDPR